MTIFDVLQFIAWLGGAVLGAKYGAHIFGTIGYIGGGIVGLIAGHFIGRLPFLLVWRSLGIQNKPTSELRRILEGNQYCIYHLALSALMARGEDISCYRDRLVNMLMSPRSDERRFGWGSLIVAFPELAEQIKDYDPLTETEICKRQALKLKGQPVP